MAALLDKSLIVLQRHFHEFFPYRLKARHILHLVFPELGQKIIDNPTGLLKVFFGLGAGYTRLVGSLSGLLAHCFGVLRCGAFLAFGLLLGNEVCIALVACCCAA